MRYTLVLIIGGLLLYLPSLFGPFLWDDEDFVYANSYVKEVRVDKFFAQSVTAGRNKQSNYFRPVQLTAYALTQSVFGFNPFIFHLLNIVVHIIAATLILIFFTTFITTVEKNPVLKNILAPIPFLIALIFLVHPVQTEAVSYISGLSDPLFVSFGLGSLITFLLKDTRRNMIPLSLLLFTASLLSKETGLIFLPLFFLITFLITKEVAWKVKLVRSVKESIPYLVIAIVYLVYHFSFINTFNMQAAWGSSPYATSLTTRLLTFVQNLYLYVGLLFFPKDLFMERDFTIAIQTNPFNWYLLGFLAVNIGIVITLIVVRRHLFDSSWRLLLFCYLAFYLSFIPYTGIILINGIFYEHFLYLPLAFFFGFFIIFGLLLRANGKTWVGSLFFSAIAVILVGFLLRNISRQFEWNNDIRFYLQTLEHAPKSIRIINGLGMAYADHERFEEAILTYQKGISIAPKVPNFYHNLANLYLAQGDITLATEYYKKSLEVDPNFIFSQKALLDIYRQTGRNESQLK